MSIDHAPIQERATNFEQAKKHLEALRASDILDADDKQYIPDAPWRYDEAGNFKPASIDELTMCCVMTGNEELEALCGALYNLIKAEEKQFLASSERNPLTAETARELGVLLAPFTPEAVTFLNSPELVWNDPERFRLRDEFRKLQSYILNLYRTTDIKLRSAQETPAVKALMEKFLEIRAAVGSVNGSDNTISHNVPGTPTHLTLIVED
jgi:hypothetical protein